MLSAPVIVLPTGGNDYITDTPTQTLSGTTEENTNKIKVNGSTKGVIFTPGETVWSWTGTLSNGENTFSIVAIEETTFLESDPATIKIRLAIAEDFITVSPPTGISLRRYQDKVEPVTTENTEDEVIGYNFYVYTQSGGLNNTYAKINKALVTEPSFYRTIETELSRTVDTAGTIRVTTITDEVEKRKYYSYILDTDRFNEMISEGSLPTSSFNQDTSLYFVITAVLYDSVLGQVTESTYSSELEGSPLTITTTLAELPDRTQTDIILTYSQELLAGDENKDTKPGTTLRDILDPISEEQARVYVVQNFLERILSVGSLLAFDDADGDGESDPVEESVPKRALQVALNLTEPREVQNIIDAQFDKLGSNVNVIRNLAQPATGTVIFYVENPPIRNMYVFEGAIVSTLGDLDQGVPAQSYRALQTKQIDIDNREEYFNSETSRYELEVEVEAVEAGEDGNTDSYTIKTAASGIDADFTLENPNPIMFGSDIETNKNFAARIQLALYADTGTEGGYAKTAVGVPGVRNVRVEKANDILMRRDWDSVREEHIGGKVDIYIEGEKTRQVQDQIAFSFESIQSEEGGLSGEVFQIINAAAFQFRSKNPQVTAHTPIFEVTKVRNTTKGEDYDISGYQIIGDGDTIDLDESFPINISIGLASADIIRVDYKFRSSDIFILENQPVNEIISVVGEISGELTTDNYELVKLQDPLEEGESTIASNGIRIKFANNLPLTEFQTITDEEHVMILETDEALNYLGADPESIKVTNESKTKTYAENIDYTVTYGTSTTPTTIKMFESGSIKNGQKVLINYNAIENFVITYTTNGLLQDVQTSINKMKSACADTIVKQAINNDVDMVITIVPKSGVTNLTNLKSKIHTAVSNYISQLGIGRSLTQSEVIHTIKKIDDVDYVVLPLIKMVKADGSFIIRDDTGTPQFEIYNEGAVKSYISLTSVLDHKTVDKGGPENLFRGIFEDQMPLILQDDALDVSDGPGRGYIRSDGKIVISTRDGELPETKKYEVSYYVYNETGANDINVASIEYLSVGTFNITFDEPRDLSKQAF